MRHRADLGSCVLRVVLVELMLLHEVSVFGRHTHVSSHGLGEVWLESALLLQLQILELFGSLLLAV